MKGGTLFFVGICLSVAGGSISATGNPVAGAALLAAGIAFCQARAATWQEAPPAPAEEAKELGQ